MASKLPPGKKTSDEAARSLAHNANSALDNFAHFQRHLLDAKKSVKAGDKKAALFNLEHAADKHLKNLKNDVGNLAANARRIPAAAKENSALLKARPKIGKAK